MDDFLGMKQSKSEWEKTTKRVNRFYHIARDFDVETRSNETRRWFPECNYLFKHKSILFSPMLLLLTCRIEMNNFSAFKPSTSNSSRLEDVVWCAVFVAEALAIVVGNFFAIFVFTTSHELRKRKTYLLISLALADLLVGLIALPLWIYQLGSRRHLWNSTLSRPGFIAYSSLDLFTNLASISNLAAISFERLYATLWPWRHLATSRTTYFLFIVVVWALCSLSSVMYSVARFAVDSPVMAMCTWLPYLCILLLFICLSYAAIFIKVRKTKHGSRLDRERKLTTTLFIITVFSLVAFIPLVVVGVFFALGTQINNLVMTILSFFNFGNCLVNPILYSFRMPVFRKAVCSLFCHKRYHQGRLVAISQRHKAQELSPFFPLTQMRVLSPIWQRRNSQSPSNKDTKGAGIPYFK